MKLPLSILLLIVAFSYVQAATTTKAPKVSCPRDCRCDRSTKTATCRLIDPEIQHFNDDIKNLVIKTFDPEMPIVLTEHIFTQLGLNSVLNIRIVNATISELHPRAFAGLYNLESVDLRATGLTSIDPNLFIDNHKLKTINLSDNPITHRYHHILNSTSAEEILICNAAITHLNSSSLELLPNAVFISFSHNKIRDIDVRSFSRLSNLEQLDLSSNDIENIPLLLFVFNKELTYLNLSNNSRFTAKGINSESLETLDISYCKILQLTESMFDEIPNLLNLKITHNGINHINPNAFVRLISLTDIDLSFNNLVNIPYQIFTNNSDLNSINLSHNPLKNLPDKGFSSNQSLVRVSHFDLSHCEIEQLHELTFSTMPAIYDLLLNNNKIKILPDMLFQHLRSLRQLDLSNNQIETFSANVFELNRDLHNLNLANNSITHLPDEAFTSLTNLISLDLSNCRLVEFKWMIPKLPVERLQSLQYLNLSNNLLTSVMKEFLEMTPNLRSFDVTNNPLECTINILSMLEWLRKHNVQGSTITHLSQVESTNDLDGKHNWDQLEISVCEKILQPDEQTYTDDTYEETLYDDEYSSTYDTKTPKDDDDDNYDDEEDDEEFSSTDNVNRVELDFENPNAQESFMRYATYTNMIMFLIGAMSSATIVFLLACICKSYRGNGRRLLIQAAFLDSLQAQRTKKDCGIVYKQLSEETVGPKTPVLSRLYEPYLQSLNGGKSEAPPAKYQQVQGGDMV